MAGPQGVQNKNNFGDQLRNILNVLLWHLTDFSMVVLGLPKSSKLLLKTQYIKKILDIACYPLGLLSASRFNHWIVVLFLKYIQVL